jgi:hypothetical protein
MFRTGAGFLHHTGGGGQYNPEQQDQSGDATHEFHSLIPDAQPGTSPERHIRIWMKLGRPRGVHHTCALDTRM